MALLNLIKREKVTVTLVGEVLVVTMQATPFRVSYEKIAKSKLVATSFHARKGLNETCRITFPKFLSLAWTAANAKARELGWIT
jgi:hypothetical protein